MIRTILFLLIFLPVCSFAQITGPKQPSNKATEYYRQQLSEQVMRHMNKIDWTHVERTTSGDSILYTIPVVVHVLYNYSEGLISDTVVANFIADVNSYFLKINPDTISIIDKYKAAATNTKIQFKLANIDPAGHRTKGIEHIYTYLESNPIFNEQAKVSQWPPEKYLNIWSGNGEDLVAYGYTYAPYVAATRPYYDGIYFDSFIFDEALDPGDHIRNRIFADFFGLPPACGNDTICTDNDEIPDTPPCITEMSATCPYLYDSTCDTPNKQNVMYGLDPCGIMFTYGQAQYMQNVMQTDIGKRDSLVTSANAIATGMDLPIADMPPIADFMVNTSPYGFVSKFAFINTNVQFKNTSWNDTITSLAWTFSNSPLLATSTNNVVYNKFFTPGWVTISLAATGNNTGTTTAIDTQALFVADTAPVSAVGYTQNFNAGGDLDKWPIFNYFNNSFKWQLANVGYDDNTSVEYVGFDSRVFPDNTSGTPYGDVDDIFTPVFDLTGFADSCYFNFMSSGAERTALGHFKNDSLEIDYTNNLGLTWRTLKSITGEDLINKATASAPYIPTTGADWIPQVISLPAESRGRQVVFRFRYHAGVDTNGYSVGNNFYLDHFNINTFPERVNSLLQENNVSIYPNPTQQGTFIQLKNNSNVSATTIVVTDITGKEVYTITTHANTDSGKIEIPRNAIAHTGIYLIHIVSGDVNTVQKLVVD